MSNNNEREALELICEILGTDNAMIIYEKESGANLSEAGIKAGMIASDSFIKALPLELMSLSKQIIDKYPAVFNEKNADCAIDELILTLASDCGLNLTQEHLENPEFLFADKSIPDNLKHSIKKYLGEN